MCLNLNREPLLLMWSLTVDQDIKLLCYYDTYAKNKYEVCEWPKTALLICH